MAPRSATSRPDGPADKAGIKSGDRIVSIAGTRVTDAASLSAAVAAQKPGEKIDVAIVRDGKPRTISVTLGNRPENASSEQSQQPSFP